MHDYKEKLAKHKTLIKNIPDFVKEELFDHLPKSYDELVNYILNHYTNGVMIGKRYSEYNKAICPRCHKEVEVKKELNSYKYKCKKCGHSYSNYTSITNVLFKYIIFSDDPRLSEPAFFNITLSCDFVNDFVININEISYSKKTIDNFTESFNQWSSTMVCNEDLLFTDNTIDQIIAAFKKQYKYSGLDDYVAAVPYANSKNKLDYCMLYIKYPHIELLLKTKYRNIVTNLIRDLSPTHEKMFKRNFVAGKNLKEILTVPEWVFPENFSLDEMNEARIIHNKYKPTKEAYETFLQFHFSVSEVRTFKQVLAMKYNGKNLYTFDKLIAYIGRCDMYQAIYPRDTVIILRDYLNMTINSEVLPDINSNSLKREHDIAARNYRLVIDKIIEDKFIEKAESLKKNSYEDKIFKVVIPKIPQDLINEGQRNRNCVGSYVSSFAKGHSKIFFIRQQNKLDDSYVTLEMRGSQVTQAYLASNRQITDKKTLDFIEKWKNNLKSKKII